jgi:para-nitrobenzyl esterase
MCSFGIIRVSYAFVLVQKVTDADKAMGALASAYWVSFGKTGDPNSGRPVGLRHDPAIDRIMHFTNGGVITGNDPLKQRLDLWKQIWRRN